MRLLPKLENHFESAYGPFPIPVTVTDESRCFVWVNSACCSFYGKPPEELLGKTAACLIHPESLERQQPAIAGFNATLGQRGYSIRRFTNHAHGKEVRVVVVAFSRSIGNRSFRVGVAMPEHLTSFTPGIADLLVQGHIELEEFEQDLRKNPKYEKLMRELGAGVGLKDATTYGGEKQNRRALDRIVHLAKKRCDAAAQRRISTGTVKNLAVLLADRLLDL